MAVAESQGGIEILDREVEVELRGNLLVGRLGSQVALDQREPMAFVEPRKG